MHLVHDRPFTHRVPDSMLSELCAEIFAQLPRSDQRRKGEMYLRGLLSVGGRKSVRNIATHVGDRAAEQSLHHFISASTWDWNTVRAALGRHLERSVRPRAWVVHPVVIPKAGRHSVGVGPRFVPSLGQVVNSQHAVGVWAANDERSGPVNWRLSLGDDWRDAPLPGYPQVPEPELAATDLECAAGAAVELQGWVGGPRGPSCSTSRRRIRPPWRGASPRRACRSWRPSPDPPPSPRWGRPWWGTTAAARRPISSCGWYGHCGAR